MKDKGKKVYIMLLYPLVILNMTCQVRLPVRWMAPESMLELKFTSQSDMLVLSNSSLGVYMVTVAVAGRMEW